jgi:hypothetical protein
MIMRPLNLSRLVIICTIALVTASCGDDVTTPTEGSIRIQTTTSGADIDPDGYNVRVDEESALAIGATGEVVINDVRIGRHLVTLAGLAANCTITEGLNPQTTDVVGDETVTVRFAVNCAPLDGGGGGVLPAPVS